MEREISNNVKLSVRDCSFPQSQNQDGRPRLPSNTKRISFAFLSSNFQKKHSSIAPQSSHLSKMAQMFNTERRNERHSQSNLMKLPEIRTRKTKNDEQQLIQEPIKSYSSTRLSIGPYRKIETLISNKYNSKIEGLIKKSVSQAKKIITISEINGEQIVNPYKIREKPKKAKQFSNLKGKVHKVTCKNHLNRIRNELAIPQQLQSRRCEEQEFDNQNFNLRLKNILRFQFDPNPQFKADKRYYQQNRHPSINGWIEDTEQGQTSAFYLY